MSRRQSQPTTVLWTRPTWMINQPQTHGEQSALLLTVFHDYNIKCYSTYRSLNLSLLCGEATGLRAKEVFRRTTEGWEGKVVCYHCYKFSWGHTESSQLDFVSSTH